VKRKDGSILSEQELDRLVAAHEPANAPAHPHKDKRDDPAAKRAHTGGRRAVQVLDDPIYPEWTRVNLRKGRYLVKVDKPVEHRGAGPVRHQDSFSVLQFGTWRKAYDAAVSRMRTLSEQYGMEVVAAATLKDEEREKKIDAARTCPAGGAPGQANVEDAPEDEADLAPNPPEAPP
jgi:hypothetical protein